MNEQAYFEQFSGEAQSLFKMHTYPLHINNVDKMLQSVLRTAMQYERWNVSVGMRDDNGNWQEKYKITSDDYLKMG